MQRGPSVPTNAPVEIVGYLSILSVGAKKYYQRLDAGSFR